MFDPGLRLAKVVAVYPDGYSVDVVFYDDEVWKYVPELAHLRDQWRLSMLSPALRITGRRALSEFLSAAKDRHEGALSRRFGRGVTIDSIDSRVVRNLEFKASGETEELEIEGGHSGFALHREEDRVFMTLWS